ncbi:MAG: alpha/beta fold hydrolase [Usitatibacter sp.]
MGSDPHHSGGAISFVEIGAHRLECLDIEASRPDAPELLLLHEGLGSVSMWRDFPAALSAATGSRVVAYSRAGFGRSSPRGSPYTNRFMHEEALRTIPALRGRLGIARPVLIGHSTGASMALVHAGANRWEVAGIVAMAPLVTLEPSNLESIRQATRIYATTDWRDKLARHHDDVDGVFRGWNDTWLDPAFQSWDILADVAAVRSPILAILGEEDPYSSPRQIDAIASNALLAARIEVLRLPGCGHAPHREQPSIVVPAIARFVDSVDERHGRARFER